jgi:hypothetical protein
MDLATDHEEQTTERQSTYKTRRGDDVQVQAAPLVPRSPGRSIMTARPNVNPFYMEPAQRQAWEDDYEPDHEEDEQEGLLPTTQHHWQPPSRTGRRHRGTLSRGKRRNVCLAGIAFVILVVLVSIRSKEVAPDMASSNSTHATASPSSDSSSNLSRVPTTSPSLVTPLPIAPSDASGARTPAPSPTRTAAPSPAPRITTAPSLRATTAAPSPQVTTRAPTNDTTPATTTPAVARELVILGERHSGRDQTRDRLAACYPNRTLRTSLSRDTYWFQDRPDDATLPRQFVLVVRNVYDWTEAMRRAPLYAPDHLRNRTTPLAWSTFVQQPWTTTTTDNETTTTTTTTTNVTTTTTTTCQLGFTPEQVVPCTLDEADSAWPEALYELDADGQVFASILALRAAKLRHMYKGLPAMYATRVTVMRWEEGLDGTLLAQLDAATGWTHSCSDGAWRLSEDVTTRRNYTADELAHLREHVDWEVEAMVGYAPRGS